jgi:monofunctional biosynthetic peptidoglycan transglycosylase
VDVWRYIWFFVRGGLLALALAVVVPLVQCLLLRVMDPMFTLTMLQRVGSSWAETGHFHWVDYRSVRLRDLPDHVPAAILTSEDQRFYDHDGFDFAAIRKAYKLNQEDGRQILGGSTISQQVAKNVFLWQRRSWLRKGLEAWYVLWLELVVPKDRILEVYLDVAETGPMTFGVEAGADHWYHKRAKDLTKQEAATIASLLPNPRERRPDQKQVRTHAGWIQRHLLDLHGESK